MKCRLVFYAARRTSLCERALKKSFPRFDLSWDNTSFATDRGSLCARLEQAFGCCDLAFAVGGTGIDGESRIKSVLEGTLAASNVTECKKIGNPDGDDGYLIRCEGQLLIVLPDEPRQIETIMRGVTGRYVEAFAKRQ